MAVRKMYLTVFILCNLYMSAGQREQFIFKKIFKMFTCKPFVLKVMYVKLLNIVNLNKIQKICTEKI